MPQYGDPLYWDKRYTEFAGSTFDWLENYESLKSLFDLFVKPSHKILQIGCGNSILSEEMYDAGFTDIRFKRVNGLPDWISSSLPMSILTSAIYLAAQLLPIRAHYHFAVTARRP